MTPTEFDPLGLLAQLGDGARSLLFDPASRTHWLFLASGLLIAAVVGWRSAALRSVEGRRAVWRRLCSRSARVDYALALLRPVVSALLITPWLLTTYALAVSTALTLRGLLGPAAQGFEAVPTWLVTGGFTLGLFVAWDASRFVLHWAMHRFDVLWQLHQVHHSAETLNPVTLYRVHPLERVLYRLRGVLVTGLLTGACFYLFGDRAVQLQVLGVSALGFGFNALGGNLRHSHVRWGWGTLERWFISPAQHQIHHQIHDQITGDTAAHLNYGTWLACWDRMAGTHVRSRDVAPASFGLADGERNHDPHSLLSALFDPVVAAAQVSIARGSGWGTRPRPIGAGLHGKAHIETKARPAKATVTA